MVIRAIAPCDIDALALVLERDADTLQPHLNVLVKSNVLQAISKAGQPVLYTREDKTIEVSNEVDSAASARELNNLVWNLIRAIQRFMKREAKLARSDDVLKDWAVMGEVSYLTSDDLVELRRLRHEIEHLLKRGRERRVGKLYTFNMLGCPISLDPPQKEN